MYANIIVSRIPRVLMSYVLVTLSKEGNIIKKCHV